MKKKNHVIDACGTHDSRNAVRMRQSGNSRFQTRYLDKYERGSGYHTTICR